MPTNSTRSRSAMRSGTRRPAAARSAAGVGLSGRPSSDGASSARLRGRLGEPSVLEDVIPQATVLGAEHAELLEDLAREFDRAEAAGRDDPAVAHGQRIHVPGRTVVRWNPLQIPGID